MLWNLSAFMIFPTFSSLLRSPCMFPLWTSSHHWTGFTTFPLSSLMPHSLRWNTILVSFFSCFISNPPPVDWTDGFHSVPFCSILVLYAFHFRFCSYCATVLQHHSSTPFLLSPILSLLIGQPFSLVTISLLGDSVFPFLHGPCTALVQHINLPLLYLCSSASSMQSQPSF